MGLLVELRFGLRGLESMKLTLHNVGVVLLYDVTVLHK